ncbi:MAG: hypothetical protein ABGW77_02670 [Campylobacterales bacterium]
MKKLLKKLDSLPRETQKRIERVIAEIKKKIENLRYTTICDYFVSNRECLRHIEKRLKLGHISSIGEYVDKIKNSVNKPEEIIWGIYLENLKKKYNKIDRLYFYREDWVTILLIDFKRGDWKIVTAFALYKKFYEEIILNKNFEQLIKIK